MIRKHSTNRSRPAAPTNPRPPGTACWGRQTVHFAGTVNAVLNRQRANTASMPNDLPHYVLRPVLIVDDVVSEAMTLTCSAGRWASKRFATTSAAEAAAVRGSVRPAAVITDLVMPGADGFDCLFMIAEHAPTVSGHGDHGVGKVAAQGRGRAWETTMGPRAVSDLLSEANRFHARYGRSWRGLAWHASRRSGISIECLCLRSGC